MIDVTIVGGGPAGLLAATRLAESGLDVLLLEEHARIGESTHCTGIVSLETAEYAKIPDDLVLSRLTRARLVGPGGGEARHLWEAGGCEAILAMDRAAFDQGLAERAGGRGRGHAAPGHAGPQDIVVAPDGVAVQTPAGVVRARACVLGAAGPLCGRFDQLVLHGRPGFARRGPDRVERVSPCRTMPPVSLAGT